MKKTFHLFAALCLAAFAVPAIAHPGHAIPGDAAYVVFWKGVVPKSGHVAGSSSPDFWRNAFVSKFRIVGAPQAALLP